MSSQPQSLPVLVLPYPRILFPTTRISISVNRTLSSAIQTLLNDNPDGHPHVLAIPTCTSPERDETPKVAKVGSIARIVRLAKAPMVRGTGFIHFVTLQGVGTRARPLSTQAQFNDSHLHQTEIELLSDNVAPSLEHVEAFRSAALVLLNRYSANSTEQARRDGWRKVQEFLEDMTVANAHHVANLIVGTVDGDHSDKLGKLFAKTLPNLYLLPIVDFLTSPDADARLISATKMIVKQTSISEVSQKIKSDVNESLSKQQKEYYLRQQLAAIQRELQQLHSSGEGSRAGGGTAPSELDDDSQQDQDELDDLKRKIEAMEKDSEERKTCVREWRRMKRIQPSSVEHGVVRSYVSTISYVLAKACQSIVCMTARMGCCPSLGRLLAQDQIR
jgi:ATP-dependent Lon protease